MDCNANGNELYECRNEKVRCLREFVRLVLI